MKLRITASQEKTLSPFRQLPVPQRGKGEQLRPQVLEKLQIFPVIKAKGLIPGHSQAHRLPWGEVRAAACESGCASRQSA